MPISESAPVELPDVTKFEREKWLEECKFRRRELAIKVNEQRRLSRQLQFQMDQDRRSRWTSPLIVAILGATIAAIGSAIVSLINSDNQLRLEEFKAQSNRILEAIKTGNPDTAAANLRFLVDLRLVDNVDIANGVRAYLARPRQPGTGAFLPASSPAPLPSRSSPIFRISASVLASFGPVDTPEREVEVMVRLLRSPIFRSLTIGGFCLRWAPAADGNSPGGYCRALTAGMVGRGVSNATEDENLSVDDKEFLKAFLRSMAQIESRSVISDSVLDSGIGNALSPRP